MKTPHSSFLILLPLILQHVLAVQAGDSPLNDQQLDDYVALLPKEQHHPSGLAAAVDHGTLNDVNLGLTADDEGNDDDEYDDNDGTDDEDEEDDEDDTDAQLVTHYDIDHEDGYYGLLQKAHNQEQEQGDDLGEEELIGEEDTMGEEGDDGDDDTIFDSTLDSNDGGLLFEDDEAPLDFKNNDQVDLDQLLFEASQKDHSSWGHDDIDQLLANADDALDVDPQDDALDEEGHPDHTTDTVTAEMMDSIFRQEQQQQQQQQQPLPLLPPPGLFNPHEPTENDDDANAATTFLESSSYYKLPLFGILVLVILVYKVSHKSQASPYNKFLLKGEKKGLPLHIKDLNTQDSLIYPNNNSPILATSPISVTTTTPITTTTPTTPTAETHIDSQHLGRRSSSSSTSSARKASLSGTGTVGGHARRISLGHHNVPTAIKESRWEEDWDDDKRRQ